MQKVKKNFVYVGISICCFVFGLLVGEKRVTPDSSQIRLASTCPSFNKGNYQVVYDSRSKIPWFVYEHLTLESLNGMGDRRRAVFYEESGLYELHRSSLLDYKGSGYDRGHMVPAADQKSSQESLNQTFSLTNICPQNSVLNRGFWKKLEIHVRALVQEYGELDVFTGPLFLPKEKNGKKYIKYEVIGDNNVAVPTHFFKLIFYPSGKDPTGYVVPNEPVEVTEDIAVFATPMSSIEKWSGVIFPGTQSGES